MRTRAKLSSIGQLMSGDQDQPFDLLGPHLIEEQGERAVAVRAYLPDADQAWVVDGEPGQSRPMRRIHPSGLFEAICPIHENSDSFQYQLRFDQSNGDSMTLHDPYAYPSMLTDEDFHRLVEGRHLKLYEKLGAQIRTVNGVRGVNFAVWAPNARSVSVIGDFNQWDALRHPMRKHASIGVWELFVPALEPGTRYKYRVNQADGGSVEKADPFAFQAEVPPNTASIVSDLNDFQWQDQAWLDRRAASDYLQEPISIYEVHLGSWRQDEQRLHGWKNYRDLAHELVEYCQQMGFTHLELMPINEHPFTGSWGYQATGYFAATSRYGSPEDFKYFVDYCHQHGIGVILDWVPAHFPKDDHGLRRFDGTALYEHEDPRQGEHPDWGTLIFNYGRNEIKNFLIASALFWMDQYHIDGIRVDAVASMLYLDYSRKEGEWIPNVHGGRENLEAIDFLKEFNETVHREYPGVLTIAEESTAWEGVSRPTYEGGLGFSIKWNMGWMNDSLRYMRNEPIHRQHHHDGLTFSIVYAFTENFMLPLSHDEVVHGKRSLVGQMPGDLWQQFANLRLLYGYMWTHPGKKLLFMGGEIGQWDEWNHNESLQWNLLQWEHHAGLQRLVADLNRLYVEDPALHELDFSKEGFEWVDCLNRDESVLVFLRKPKRGGEPLIVCCNFTPVVRQHYQIGVDLPGHYEEILNSDAGCYAGSNVGNPLGMETEAKPAQDRPHSLRVTLPPLSTVILKRRR
ncbi:MAG: 1,4-alpha-glucan branching protein GlgB [Planctomycetota bacterium]|nr:1,4-alpha-glucan branching protein GlgB [Planctomycetota bacterium]